MENGWEQSESFGLDGGHRLNATLYNQFQPLMNRIRIWFWGETKWKIPVGERRRDLPPVFGPVIM